MKLRLLVCGLLAGTVLAARDTPTVSITVHVQDEDGSPIAGAKAAVGGGLSPLSGSVPSKASGVTDANGNFHAVIASTLGNIGIYADAPGYYRSGDTGLSLRVNGQRLPAEEGKAKWEPWERTFTFTLRRIGHPVPMYAKRIDLAVPDVGKPVGYDLEQGDWVAPYGKGKVADIEVTADGRYESAVNYSGTLTIRFPGTGNGIQPYEIAPTNYSRLKLPHSAPNSGYQSDWTWKNARTTPSAPYSTSTFVDESFPQRGFIFRVRAKVDDAGHVVSACYGKIHGPVAFQTFEHGAARFGLTYYFNPDGTPNLELDEGHDLFAGERVEGP